MHKSENSSFLEAVSIFENSPTLRSVDVFKFWFSINF
ncbi:polyphosphate kinase 2 (PPK2 family) [Comamonas odontotermitis]|uniref:Polyphosphate kinase 2 (PPK2 family) n=1 Tax=Comamonas odontotermitis TaxID=379895 RepID=A0ABR6RL74_9BURK|nr:polyphosphate kinase 2 (PPK2 family) [Comamonas odontotermitis]